MILFSIFHFKKHDNFVISDKILSFENLVQFDLEPYDPEYEVNLIVFYSDFEVCTWFHSMKNRGNYRACYCRIKGF